MSEIYLVDDHTMLRDGLRAVLQADLEFVRDALKG